MLRDAITTSCIKPEVWISISGVGYYPPSTDQRYDEDSEVESSDIWSNLTKSWEESANLPEDLTETRHVIIRSGKNLKIKSLFDLLFDLLNQGL